jgi:hypothetical protein
MLFPLNAVSNWSRGMIPASGAGGPGFDSRIGPFATVAARVLYYESTVGSNDFNEGTPLVQFFLLKYIIMTTTRTVFRRMKMTVYLEKQNSSSFFASLSSSHQPSTARHIAIITSPSITRIPRSWAGCKRSGACGSCVEMSGAGCIFPSKRLRLTREQVC